MRTRRSLLIAASAAAFLAACSKDPELASTASNSNNPETPPTPRPKGPRRPASSGPVDYRDLAHETTGFRFGAPMRRTVYVFFDAQCPHCAALWSEVQSLKESMSFVWVPVSFMGPKSISQGAAILTAKDPVEAMNSHEKSMTAREGGISASKATPEMVAAIEANTEVLSRLGASSVPFIVGRGPKGLITQAGGMPAADLAKMFTQE